MEKKDLISGKHWVEIRNGEIGCMVDNGFVFRDFSFHKSVYTEDLKSKYGDEYTIIRILETKFDSLAGNFKHKPDFDIIVEVNQHQTNIGGENGNRAN